MNNRHHFLHLLTVSDIWIERIFNKRGTGFYFEMRVMKEVKQ